MNPSAMSAVELSLARSRTSARGRKTTISITMKYCTGMSFAQLVTPRTKAWRFSATKIVYAATKPSWEMTIELRIR